MEAFSITDASVPAYVVALHIFLVAPVSQVGLVVLWRSTIPKAAAVAVKPLVATEAES